MSIWGKVLGATAGFVFGGPLGALVGGAAGHMADKARAKGTFAKVSANAKQAAFASAVIVLGAKMAKADGHVSRDEVLAFKQAFRIPQEDMADVARIFDMAKKDAGGFEVYARQVAHLFKNEPEVLEQLIAGLLHIALADGAIHPAEQHFLETVAQIFGFSTADLNRIFAQHGGTGGSSEEDPYTVLGVASDVSDAALKKAYRDLLRENHPDTLMAKGLPQEFIDLANEKMGAINAAYDAVKKARGIS